MPAGGLRPEVVYDLWVEDFAPGKYGSALVTIASAHVSLLVCCFFLLGAEPAEGFPVDPLPRASAFWVLLWVNLSSGLVYQGLPRQPLAVALITIRAA